MSFAGTDYGKAQSRKLDRRWGSAQQNAENLFRSASFNQLLALRKIDPAYNKALSSVDAQGRVMARDVGDQASIAEAGLTAGAISSGLYNTSAYDAGRRSVRIAKQRTLAEIDQQVAERRASIQAARGEAIAGQRNQMATTKLNYVQTLAAMAAKKSGNYASILYGKQGGLAGPLSQIAGTAVGLWAGSGSNDPNRNSAGDKIPFKGNNGPVVNNSYPGGGY